MGTSNQTNLQNAKFMEQLACKAQHMSRINDVCMTVIKQSIVNCISVLLEGNQLSWLGQCSCTVCIEGHNASDDGMAAVQNRGSYHPATRKAFAEDAKHSQQDMALQSAQGFIKDRYAIASVHEVHSTSN